MFSIFDVLNLFTCRRVSETAFRPESYTESYLENYCCPGYTGSAPNCRRKYNMYIYACL